MKRRIIVADADADARATTQGNTVGKWTSQITHNGWGSRTEGREAGPQQRRPGRLA